MSTRSNLGAKIIAVPNDNPSRRHLVTGAAVVAALGGATAEALAQGAPGGGAWPVAGADRSGLEGDDALLDQRVKDAQRIELLHSRHVDDHLERR